MKISGDSYEVFTSENTSIPNIAISCITQGPNGNMYFGTYDNREKMTPIIRYDGKNWELAGQNNSPMHPYGIWDVLSTGDNEFWVATVIGLFHHKEGTWKSYFEDENEYRRDIKKISIDKNNNLYITNNYMELYSANLNNSNVRFNKVNVPGYPQQRAGRMYCNIDSLNNMWINHSGKQYKKEGNNWKDLDTMGVPIATKDKKLYAQLFGAVYEYKENSYWEKIFEIPDSVGGVLLRDKDSKGNFWFAGGNRLYKYTPEKASVKQNTNITLYPNPAQNTITIKTEEPITKLALFSLSLSKITDYPPNHTTNQEIDISNLASGIYFLKVNDELVKFVRE
jgi:hypothetical protein